jgi:RimJ/RimL family protein N-acetyltransferase
MSPRTERDFAEPGREPSRRRFMIAGEHVILRAFERDDAERCYRWINDPNIFDEMNLGKLRINVFDYNDRAKHVLEALGFVQEGCLRRDFYREGSYHDIVILSKFRDAAPRQGES